MATIAQPGSGSDEGSRQMRVEKSVENIMTTLSREYILTALVLLGLLLIFVAQLVRIGATAAGAGASAHNAYLVLAAIGSYLMIGVLFVGGVMKRNENQFVRFGLLIAAGLLFIGAAMIL